ncbi:hypothetical protein [Archangium primigenium]|uniref:hypothetical protein n=1 Tax=[Archangium] primigenium TaxID=2792470 RepID=UPI00195EC108|nr:hypothetical protein [Archangium primigenium]MBM7116694.1 hypothetical protein [Archangium primigenium]
MPGPLLGQDTRALCPHGGQARFTALAPRVRLGGVPVVVQTGTFLVSGCPQSPPVGPPCVSGQFLTAATRVRAGGQPVLLRDSRALCAPTPAPLQVLGTQVRVKGF